MQSFLIYFTGLLLGGWAWVQLVEPNWFHLSRKTVRVKKPLPKPLTILHISDPHFVGERFFLTRFFDRLARLEADLVFVTGDLIDDPKGIQPCLANLKKLKSKYGTFVVLGNHDYRIYPPYERVIFFMTGKALSRPRPEAQTEELKQALTEAGFHLLLNRNVSVNLEGQEAVLIGTDDPVTGRVNLQEAFRGVENGVLRLALTHSPLIFSSLGRRGVDVAFAGHTHGGQIRLPFLGALPWAYRVVPIVDSTDRYGFFGLVSRGLGAQPIARQRLFCRPEAVLVRIEGS